MVSPKFLACYHMPLFLRPPFSNFASASDIWLHLHTKVLHLKVCAPPPPRLKILDPRLVLVCMSNFCEALEPHKLAACNRLQNTDIVFQDALLTQ